MRCHNKDDQRCLYPDLGLAPHKSRSDRVTHRPVHCIQQIPYPGTGTCMDNECIHTELHTYIQVRISNHVNVQTFMQVYMYVCIYTCMYALPTIPSVVLKFTKTQKL